MASLWLNATTHPNVSKSWKVFFFKRSKFSSWDSPAPRWWHKPSWWTPCGRSCRWKPSRRHRLPPGRRSPPPSSTLLPWAPLALAGLQRLDGLLLCNSRLSTNDATNFPDISQSSMEWICKAKTYGILPNIAKLSHQIPLTWLSISPIFTCCLSVRLSANLSSPTISFFFIIYTITYEILRHWHQL